MATTQEMGAQYAQRKQKRVEKFLETQHKLRDGNGGLSGHEAKAREYFVSQMSLLVSLKLKYNFEWHFDSFGEALIAHKSP